MAGILGDGASKKLIAASRYWVMGGGEFDQAREDLRQFGATDEQLAAQFGPKEEGCLVDQENWEAWGAFMAIQTQWISAPMGGLTGLDYARVKVGLELAGFAVTPELWQKLRVIESGVLATLAKRERQAARK